MGIVATALRKMRSARAFSAFELALIPGVMVLLGLARLAVLTLPFRTYARFFGTQVALDQVPQALSPQSLARARTIGRVVRRGAGNTPWASVCLPQAMVAGLLLRLADIPHCVIFGVTREQAGQGSDPFAAHVWIRAGDTNVTGGQDVRAYTVVSVFQRRARNPR